MTWQFIEQDQSDDDSLKDYIKAVSKSFTDEACPFIQAGTWLCCPEQMLFWVHISNVSFRVSEWQSIGYVPSGTSRDTITRWHSDEQRIIATGWSACAWLDPSSPRFFDLFSSCWIVSFQDMCRCIWPFPTESKRTFCFKFWVGFLLSHINQFHHDLIRHYDTLVIQTLPLSCLWLRTVVQQKMISEQIWTLLEGKEINRSMWKLRRRGWVAEVDKDRGEVVVVHRMSVQLDNHMKSLLVTLKMTVDAWSAGGIEKCPPFAVEWWQNHAGSQVIVVDLDEFLVSEVRAINRLC
jgi:hypothetical protein